MIFLGLVLYKNHKVSSERFRISLGAFSAQAPKTQALGLRAVVAKINSRSGFVRIAPSPCAGCPHALRLNLTRKIFYREVEKVKEVN
jgi:hypothetical protein